MRRNRLAAAAILLFAAGPLCAQQGSRGEISPFELGETPNLTTLDERIFFAGQPAEADLAAWAERGVKTVINLRTGPEMERLDFDEKAAVEAAGMTYVHAPIGREEPGEELLGNILGLLADSAAQPILLHCGSSNRVGMVWSMFLATEEGASLEAAIAGGRAAGMTNASLEQRARSYIESRDR